MKINFGLVLTIVVALTIMALVQRFFLSRV